jgi:hypothetical protein
MKKTVEIEKFDLMRFAEKTLDYCKTILDPEMELTSGIGSAEDYSSVPEFSDRKERDLQREILEENLMLFFPFIMGETESPIVSADGSSFSYDPDDEDSEYSILSDPMIIYGFTIRKEDKNLIIESAAYYPGGCTFPPPFLEYKEDCSFLEEPMEKFIDSFIKARHY